MKKIVLANCGTLEPSTLSALKDKYTELGYELVEEEKLKIELPQNQSKEKGERSIMAIRLHSI